MLFLTSFQTHHVTCCVSVGVKTEAGVKKKTKKQKCSVGLHNTQQGPAQGILMDVGSRSHAMIYGSSFGNGSN